MFQRCQICHDNAQTRSSQKRDALLVDCESCGSYFAELGLDAAIDSQMPHSRHLLAGYMFHRRSNKRPTITISDAVSIVSGITELDPLQKLDQLLSIVRRTLDRPDQAFSQNDVSRQAVYARDKSELDSLLEFALEMDWVNETRSGTFGGSPEYSLSAQGWEHLRTITTSTSNNSTAFVAMDFRDELTTAYDKGIAPALRSTGWNPVRADRVEHAGSIDDLVISQIRESGLVVADFTFQNQGVYYEAGFAFGIGVQVIWTCREDQLSKVHFDTRQYSHVVWKNNDDLESKLTTRIRAMNFAR